MELSHFFKITFISIERKNVFLILFYLKTPTLIIKEMCLFFCLLVQTDRINSGINEKLRINRWNKTNKKIEKGWEGNGN